ncbi:hypothetical protein FA10DRAFT_265768 [Acaromyces ingoldii]|uniref:Uncharacterized protein n=1 Tax=Acaromyces ingoldii TaxID=215250 RepID=A0A316YQX6_9BASI|nr:hypothetical protein FA10DRAFT_265768 [Acaromyces ingoldii]PWN91950.1 hypothetical protein FA10DRAFT_265768 [Acaromyces ingoldii]
MSDYELRLCSSAADLRAAHEVRLEVFHREQGFPADTEVDEYDPVSAHFIVVERHSARPVGVIRLTPYPREEVLALAPPPPPSSSAKDAIKKADDGGLFRGGAMEAEEAKRSNVEDNSIPQEQTSMVTAGGGPGGTSGGLPMFPNSATKQTAAGSAASDKRQSDKDDRAQDVVGQSGVITVDETPAGKLDSSYPLGGVQSSESLAHLFRRVALAKPAAANAKGAAHGHDSRGAKISRLAVLRSERGKHLGEQAVRGAEKWLLDVLSTPAQGDEAHKDTGVDSIDVVLSSQMHAVNFYKKLSYQTTGEPYDEEGAPHMWCLKKLAFERA